MITNVKIFTYLQIYDKHLVIFNIDRPRVDFEFVFKKHTSPSSPPSTPTIVQVTLLRVLILRYLLDDRDGL